MTSTMVQSNNRYQNKEGLNNLYPDKEMGPAWQLVGIPVVRLGGMLTKTLLIHFGCLNRILALLMYYE